MHGHSRLGRPKSGGVGAGPGSHSSSSSSSWSKFVFLLMSAIFRRRGLLLFAPLLYISGMLLYMGSLSFDVVLVHKHPRPHPGSLYTTPLLFHNLWPFMEADNASSPNVLMKAWNLNEDRRWKPCANKTLSQIELPKSNGYLIIEANGGLNQQRLSICDAVAVAGLLNATLVIPIFHLNSVWRDSSHFGDIFDENFFIQSLEKHVHVVRELPVDVLERFGNNVSNIVNLRVKAWSSPSYYIKKVLPHLLEMSVVRIAPFSNRLAPSVPSKIQGLRCFANYEALRFSEPIRSLAETMVDRMIKHSSQSGGKYVSVHLRFEEDMVAFSCCVYDGGAEEKHEMDIARERSWRGKFRRKHRIIKPGVHRVEGRCPLTPLEVGMMLRGMGFDNTTLVYVAAGKIYKEQKYMAPLKQMFPRLLTKYTLATAEELAQFKRHSSRLAALDYTVCLHSEAFVTTQGGNFPHFLMGHRRYMYGGHSKTIKPEKRKLVVLFDNPDVRWEVFKQQMKDMLQHSDERGTDVKKTGESLYTFPMPDCMSKQVEPNNENANIGKNMIL
ncbi:O-fucosyltransferase 9 isoform X1 [Vicia villosa]|uniref:O-fucosyltransferase 9 isoform X1 n=1 Tax=Vicia villosa TaxID=3911 RepID=UPI00273B6EF2|nr:O-fucosyltransferase 9 isoform X1 [Vicia villosa]